jgi:hypothetical protein
MEYVFTRFRVLARREDDCEVFAFDDSKRDVARFAVVMASVLLDADIPAKDARSANQIKTASCQDLLTFGLAPSKSPVPSKPRHFMYTLVYTISS